MVQFLLQRSILLTCQFILFQHQANAKSLVEIDIALKKTIQNSYLYTNILFRPTSPIRGLKMTSSNFGQRQDPFTGVLQKHYGVDYPAKIGSPIVATEAGTVLRAGYFSSYGQLVEIDHGLGMTSKYSHASQLLVRVGQVIQKGQVIALVGNTGHSTGPHLHFEIAQNGWALNPLAFITEELQTSQINQSNKYIINNQKNDNISFDRRNIKSYLLTGDVIVAARVRSGKSITW